MGKIGYGYGSECHLLRFLGRHREFLEERILDATGFKVIRWLDFNFKPTEKRWQDEELKGMEFLKGNERVHAAWKEFWPQRGNPQNWDAIAEVRVNNRKEWLLVEAKAHLQELRSNCSAKKQGGRDQIKRALDVTKQALGVSPQNDWLKGYYQYCNRIAALYFLSIQKIPAHLLFIYFTGDDGSAYKVPQICPKDEDGWSKTLGEQKQAVGLPPTHPLKDRIHELFLNVCGPVEK